MQLVCCRAIGPDELWNAEDPSWEFPEEDNTRNKLDLEFSWIDDGIYEYCRDKKHTYNKDAKFSYEEYLYNSSKINREESINQYRSEGLIDDDIIKSRLDDRDDIDKECRKKYI